MATVASVCTEIDKTTDLDKLDWVAWEPGSQNPPVTHSASLGDGCSVSLTEAGEIVIYAPDGEKGRTETGFATMKAKAEAYIAKQAADEEEEAVTKSLDEIEAALKELQVVESKVKEVKL